MKQKHRTGDKIRSWSAFTLTAALCLFPLSAPASNEGTTSSAATTSTGTFAQALQNAGLTSKQSVSGKTAKPLPTKITPPPAPEAAPVAASLPAPASIPSPSPASVPEPSLPQPTIPGTPALSTPASPELPAPTPPGTVLATGSHSTGTPSWKEPSTNSDGFRIRPNLAMNFRKGYKLTIGPELMIDAKFSNDINVRFDVSYLPLRFRDADGQIAYTQAGLRITRFFGENMFLRLAAGIHSFKPNGSLNDFIRARGGNISARTIPSYQIGVGYRVFTFRFAFWGRKRTIPIFATADYTWMDQYRYGIPLGDAGDTFRTGRDFRVGLQMMMRKF